MNLARKITEHVPLVRRVSTEYGVSPLRQLSEIAALARSPGQIGPGDYYAYRLFDPALAMDEKRRFVGWKAESRLDALNDRFWNCLGLDKVLMYSLFDFFGPT